MMLLIAWALGCAPAAPAATEEDAVIAVTVNGTAISVRQLRAQAVDRASFDEFRAQIVEAEIGDQLVRDEAARRGVALRADEEGELARGLPPAALLADQARGLGLGVDELVARRLGAMRARRLLQRLIEREQPGALSPSEAALREAFDRAPLAYADRPTATVRALLVPLAPDADAGAVAAATDRAARLLAAARSAGSAHGFSQLAADNGALPPGSPDGALGSVALGDPFERPPAIPALFGPSLSAEVVHGLFPGPELAVNGTTDLAPEAVLGPFRGPLGVFGLFVEQRQLPAAAPPFERVRERVRARWVGRAVMSLGPAMIQRLRASSTISYSQGVTAS